MTVSLWRIASDTPSYTAEDMAGKGAASSGARWNHAGEHVTYAATSISLAAWETRAHFAKGIMLPWNRILVRIDVPDGVWATRLTTPRPLPVGWNVVPEGMISRSIGSAWLAGEASSLLVMPSMMIIEEDNVLINPERNGSRCNKRTQNAIHAKTLHSLARRGSCEKIGLATKFPLHRTNPSSAAMTCCEDYNQKAFKR